MFLCYLCTLGTWEMIHNPNFKVVEFDHFRMQAGLPSFVMSVSEWIEKTNAIGIIVKKGRYGGTYAFKDIAFEFGTAISVTFKLYLIDEFQRLKEEEQKQLGWTAKRELSKINYRIHTRCHQKPSDTQRSHLCTGKYYLCRGSRRAECSNVWNDG